MKRWKPLFANHWRSKLVSLALAALVWLLLRPHVPRSFDPPPSSARSPAVGR